MTLNRVYRDGQFKCFLAKDLDEAYSLGMFSGSMHRDELMERVTKHNPSLRWFANATHRCLWDVDKHDKGFICGIPHFSIIPKVNIMEYDFSKDRELEYTNLYGEVVGHEIVNEDECEYKLLALGWNSILSAVEKKGYQVDRRGI